MKMDELLENILIEYKCGFINFLLGVRSFSVSFRFIGVLEDIIITTTMSLFWYYSHLVHTIAI